MKAKLCKLAVTAFAWVLLCLAVTARWSATAGLESSGIWLRWGSEESGLLTFVYVQPAKPYRWIIVGYERLPRRYNGHDVCWGFRCGDGVIHQDLTRP